MGALSLCSYDNPKYFVSIVGNINNAQPCESTVLYFTMTLQSFTDTGQLPGLRNGQQKMLDILYMEIALVR